MNQLLRHIFKKFHSPHTSAGFTLVELLIYMGLLSMLMFVLTDIFTSTLSLQTETEATSVVEQDGRYLLSRLSYDINRATSITTPATLGTTTSSLSIVIGGTTYSYAVSNGKLQITNANGTDNLNSMDTTISNLTFTRLGNTGGKNTIQLSFTLTGVPQPKSGALSRTYQTVVGIR